MKKEIFYRLLIVLFCLYSCSREDYSSINSDLPKALKTIYLDDVDGSFVTDFIYDGNKIVSIINKFCKRDYEYEDNHIVKETIFSFYNGKETKDSETFYGYENEKLKVVKKLVNGEETKYLYIYNEDGTITKETYNLNHLTKDESKSAEYEVLTLINGNLVKSEFDWSENYNIISNWYYEYDKEKNAFKNIEGLDLLLDQFDLGTGISFSSANNILSAKASHIQNQVPAIVFEPYRNIMKYEYNAKGYPIKKVTYDYADRIIEIVEYIY